MRRGQWCAIAAVIGLLAIASGWPTAGDPPAQNASVETARPLLNSERIKQKFGSYGIDVLEDDGKLRISSLYTTDGHQKITRTLAVVIYLKNVPEQLQQEHQEIRGGGSMGETFIRHGWQVEKENLYLGEIQASPDFDEIYSLMGSIAPVNLAVHVYRLSVCKSGSCFDYAMLSEVHHPDYLTLPDLKEIYGEPDAALAHSSKPNGEQDEVDDRKDEQDVREALDLTVAALAAQ